MNKIASFKGKDITINIIVTIIIFIVGYSILEHQKIGGVALMVGSLFASLTIFQDDIKTVLYDNVLVVHKVFQKKEILLQNINSIYEENRANDLYNVIKCLVISYTEQSGYGDELVYAYDKYLYLIKILNDSKYSLYYNPYFIDLFKCKRII